MIDCPTGHKLEGLILVGESNRSLPRKGVEDEFQILEVDPWTRTPISLDIGTVAIPLSMYVLIKNRIKRVPIPSLDTDTGIGIGYI